MIEHLSVLIRALREIINNKPLGGFFSSILIFS